MSAPISKKVSSKTLDQGHTEDGISELATAMGGMQISSKIQKMIDAVKDLKSIYDPKAVVELLKDLPDHNVKELGKALELQDSTLDDIVSAWLRREESNMKDTLIGALKKSSSSPTEQPTKEPTAVDPPASSTPLHMSTQPLMSDWLVEKIDSGEFQGLEWLDQEQKIFKVPWIHGNKLDYDKKKDTALFKEWAIYSDKYKDGSDVKGDFCSSLYRQKDIIERRELKKRDYRVYQKSCNKLNMKEISKLYKQYIKEIDATKLKQKMDSVHDLPIISEYITDWESKLVVPLGIPANKVKDIKTAHPTQPVLERKEVLRVWMGIAKSNATYKNLIKACIEGGHEYAAKNICKYVQDTKKGTELPTTQVGPDDTVYTGKKTFGPYDKPPKGPAVVSGHQVIVSARTLEEICKHVKVSLKALDQECTDEGQDILTGYCGPWKSVARKLFPSADTVENIIDDIEGGNKKLMAQRAAFICTWRNKLAFKATYEVFIKALLELKQFYNVKNILKELKAKKLLDSGSLSQPPKESTVTTLKLTEKDQFTIRKELKHLSDSDVKKLGKALQLQGHALEIQLQSLTLADIPLDINVLLESIIKDNCTWDHLIEALKKIGRDSEAERINFLYTGKKEFGHLGPFPEEFTSAFGTELPTTQVGPDDTATTSKLTESDQDAICQFLKHLPGSDVKKLGEILQLQSRTLEKMKDYPLDIKVLLESIIKDACTWDHLIKALEKIGRDSEAKKISGLHAGKKTFGNLGVYDKHPKEPAVGFDVIGEISVPYKQEPIYEIWRGYGFRMYIPRSALPPGQKECVLNIKAAISGKVEFPDGMELMSGIFSIENSSSCSLKSVKVEFEHFSHVSDNLIFAGSYDHEPPFKFQKLDGGIFNLYYGKIITPIQRRIYMCVASLFTSGSSVEPHSPSNIDHAILGSRYPPSPANRYCAYLYYCSSGHYNWEIYFAILKDHGVSEMLLKKKFMPHNITSLNDEIVEFSDESIELDITDRKEIQLGWIIAPLKHPMIKKSEVDQFDATSQHPPLCKLRLECDQSSPKDLYFKLKLIGANPPRDFLALIIDNPIGGHQQQQQPTHECTFECLNINHLTACKAGPFPFTYNLLGLKDIPKEKRGEESSMALIDDGYYPNQAMKDVKVSCCCIYKKDKCLMDKLLEKDASGLLTRPSDSGQSGHCHATAVAGIAAGKGFNGIVFHDRNLDTVEYPGGVAPDAQLKIFTIPTYDPEGTYQYLEYALDMINREEKVDVVSMSLRAGDQSRFECGQEISDNIRTLRGKIIDRIQEIRRKGTHVLATASNSANTTREMEFPAQLDEVISIGSLDQRGDFSKHTRTKKDVNLYCYGEVRAPCYCKKTTTQRSHTPHKLVQDVSGSSFAAPAIAGLICLIMQHARDCDKEWGDNQCETLLQQKRNILKAIDPNDERKVIKVPGFLQMERSSILKTFN